MRTRTHINVGVFGAFCLLRQAEVGNKGVLVGTWITRILKNLGLFPIQEPGDCVGKFVRLSAAPIIGWGYKPQRNEGNSDDELEEIEGYVPEQNAEAEIQEDEPQEPRARRSSAELLQELSTKVQSMQEEQQRMMKKQNRLKWFLQNCFTKLGETLGIDFASCSCSSDEDVRVDPHTRVLGSSSRQEEGGHRGDSDNGDKD